MVYNYSYILLVGSKTFILTANWFNKQYPSVYINEYQNNEGSHINTKSLPDHFCSQGAPIACIYTAHSSDPITTIISLSYGFDNGSKLSRMKQKFAVIYNK